MAQWSQEGYMEEARSIGRLMGNMFCRLNHTVGDQMLPTSARSVVLGEMLKAAFAEVHRANHLSLLRWLTTMALEWRGEYIRDVDSRNWAVPELAKKGASALKDIL